ncbi:MAG: bifunctional metallophosphatase/5'-nucleotidase [Lactobacillus sp.]|uniref:bifunctional metallophosphatase/5'-nucleotidase n=1 Tax=Bombilactobacillus bombi TaxID=1303590 RepID=UPI0035E998A2|nr:bifunctional metallophosphatase/5'-nucleotidase [Lactobacillus sp.]
MEQLHIIHTNDLHSHFENFPRIARYIKQQRLLDQQQQRQTFLFDIGDASDRVHPLTEATMAQANIEWMNQQHYDAATIGNSEGLYYNHSILEHMYDHANFPIILDNLYEKNGNLPAFVQQSKIFTTKVGTKIGLLGLTAPYMLTYPLLDWNIKLVQDVLPALIKKLRPQVDILILLSHLGINTDRYLCQKYPQLDLIIGGHSHHLLPKGELHATTLVTAAQKYGHYIGNIYLTVNNHQVQSTTAHTIETTTIPEQVKDKQIIANYQNQGENLLKSRLVAHLPYQLDASSTGAHPAINTALKAIEWATNTPAAMLSTGLFLTDLTAGVITENDLHQQLPHAIHLMKTTLSGREFWRLMMEVTKNRNFLRNFPQKGMGFRGKIFGDLVLDGVAVNEATRQVFYQGQELIPDKEYSIALLDHYLFIPFFPTLQIVGDNQLIYPDFLRTTFAKYLALKYPLKAGEKNGSK